MQRGMTELNVFSDRRVQQRGHQRRVEQLVRPGPLIVPRPYAQTIGRGRLNKLIVTLSQKLDDLFTTENFVEKPLEAAIAEYSRESDIAVPMKRGEVIRRRFFHPKYRFHPVFIFHLRGFHIGFFVYYSGG